MQQESQDDRLCIVPFNSSPGLLNFYYALTYAPEAY